LRVVPIELDAWGSPSAAIRLTRCNGPVQRPFMMDQIFETFDTPDRPEVSNMKKPVKPKEILGGRPNKPGSLREQYSELLKLREEIRRLSSRINPQRRYSA
jgi:hypothetical protein